MGEGIWPLRPEVPVLAVLPLTLWSLATGSKPPAHGVLRKLYAAQMHLMLTGNVFLLLVCATAVNNLARHFGLIDAARAQIIGDWLMVPFLVLLVAFLVLLIRAYLKVRGASTAG
jgi:hypothetical protein